MSASCMLWMGLIKKINQAVEAKCFYTGHKGDVTSVYFWCTQVLECFKKEQAATAAKAPAPHAPADQTAAKAPAAPATDEETAAQAPAAAAKQVPRRSRSRRRPRRRWDF